jgi:hypothetical protein
MFSEKAHFIFTGGDTVCAAIHGAHPTAATVNDSSTWCVQEVSISVNTSACTHLFLKQPHVLQRRDYLWRHTRSISTSSSRLTLRHLAVCSRGQGQCGYSGLHPKSSEKSIRLMAIGGFRCSSLLDTQKYKHNKNTLCQDNNNYSYDSSQ